MQRCARGVAALARRRLCTDNKQAPKPAATFFDRVKPLTDATKKNFDSFSKQAAKQAQEAANTFNKARDTAVKGAASGTGSTEEKDGSGSRQQAPQKSFMEHVKIAIEDIKSELLTDARSTRADPYEAGKARGLRRDNKKKEEMSVQINEDATSIRLHKDNAWHKQWEQFRENNKFVQGLFGIKMRFDESDNLIVRSIRSVTERVEESMQGEDSEILQVMTALQRVDPDFDKEEFIVEVEKQIFPGVLESLYKGDLSTLKKWCNEPAFAVVEATIKQTDFKSRMTRIIDIGKTEMVTAMFIDQAPVLVFQSRVQTVDMERNPKTGEAIPKPDDKINMTSFVLALSKDVDRFDSEWEVVELGAMGSEQDFI